MAAAEVQSGIQFNRRFWVGSRPLDGVGDAGKNGIGQKVNRKDRGAIGWSAYW
jgi:hypothetical protein